MTAAPGPRLGRLLVLVTGITMAAASLGMPARATYGAHTTADEPYYLLTAQSLADDGDLDIADQLAAGAFTPYHAIPVDPQTTPLDEDGRRVSPHDPLLSIVLAPAIALGGWVAAKGLLVVLAGATAALTVWLAVRRFDVSPRVAGVVVTGLAAGMPLAPYGSQVYPELPAALTTLLGVAAISAIRGATGGTAPRAGLLPVAGICAAVTALPWLSIKYAPVAAVLAVLAGRALWAEGRRRTVLTAAGVLAVAGVVYLLAHQALYGGWTVYAAGDHFTGTGELSVVGVDPSYVGRARRIVGLLVDRSFGIGTWAPAWLLAPAALGLLVARRQPGRGLLLWPVAAGWTTATFVALTMHGWWVPGRQVVVILPLMAIAVAALVDHVRALLVPTVAALVAGASSWVWLAVEASTGRRTLVVDFDQTAAPAYRLLAPLMPDGLTGGPTADALLLLWTLLLAATVVLTVRRHAITPDMPHAVTTAPPDSTLQRTTR